MNTVAHLDQAVKKVCPIHGVARLREGTVRIDFKDEATPAQRAAAQAVVDAWDWDAPIAEDVEKEAKKAALLAIDLKKIGDPALKAVVEYLQNQENP